MGALALATAASGALSFAGGLIGSNRQRKMAREEREWQEKMWNMENEYNTPVNQKKRMIDAGLNPSLMYQTAPQNVSGNVGSPNYSNAVAEGQRTQSMFDTLGTQATAMVNQQIQNDAIRADTALKQQEYRFREENNPLSLSGHVLENKHNEYKMQATIIENEIRKISYKYEELKQQNGIVGGALDNILKGQRSQELAKSISYMDENQKLFVREKLQLLKNMAQQVKTMKSQEALNYSQKVRNDILADIDRFEREYRGKGISFGDPLPFREVKDIIQEVGKQAVYNNTGGGITNRSNVAQTIADMLLSLFY